MAYYAREDFFNNPELIERSVEILRGSPRFDWMDLDVERVRCRPSRPERGLTYSDTNVGGYGWDAIPEKIRHNFSMAPRGAVQPPGLPNLGYDINRKSEVWSENCAELYEESKARHWIPTREVPWSALAARTHGHDLERALAQLYTDLTSMATAMGDVQSRWVWHINQELLELKSWQCTQMFDAARLADVFRKRAIAGGAGLGRDHAVLGELLKGVFDAGTYPCASAAANLTLAGLMQLLLRHVGARSPNAADVFIATRGVQDVSRFLAYGMGHFRNLLAVRPHERTALVDHVDELEELLVGLLGSPLFFSALALLSGGSRAEAPGAASEVIRLYARLAVEQGERRRAAGLVGEKRTPLQVFAAELEVS